jgi:hypothetical protein
MFTKGVCANPKGRPKGATNKVTRDIAALARGLFDAAYWKRTKERLVAGKLTPAIERTLLAYAYGEPKKTVTFEGEVSVAEKRGILRDLPDAVVQQLAARAAFQAVEDEPDESEIH